MIYWASGRGSATPDTKHTNFKLSQTKNTNEVLSIADAAMAIIDSVTIKKTQLGHSRGRLNNTGDWYVLTQPNPGETNGNSPTFIAYADRPDFEPAAGFYADSVQVTLINNEPNSILRYTLNGNEPTASSTEYIGPITITATTVLKAKSFSTVPGILPGFIEYATYFINVAHTLPIISIAGNQLTQLFKTTWIYRIF
jgi:N-acetyl-beta-hexosaminidase